MSIHAPRANLKLKLAIFADGRKQQEIALLAAIPPQRLSHAVYGRRELLPIEQARIASVLRRTVEELFPPVTEQALPTLDAVEPIHEP
jgi:hypothetical protein